MGAAKEHRDAKHFRELDARLDEHYSCRQIESQLEAELNHAINQVVASKLCHVELEMARSQIARLKAEIEVLRDQKRRFFDTVENCKRHITIVGNPTKKYAVALVKSQLIKAKLI